MQSLVRQIREKEPEVLLFVYVTFVRRNVVLEVLDYWLRSSMSPSRIDSYGHGDREDLRLQSIVVPVDHNCSTGQSNAPSKSLTGHGSFRRIGPDRYKGCFLICTWLVNKPSHSPTRVETIRLSTGPQCRTWP